MTIEPITTHIDGVFFQLKEQHDFEWLRNMGSVFCVFDQQDSGNISFGVERDGEKVFVNMPVQERENMRMSRRKQSSV